MDARECPHTSIRLYTPLHGCLQSGMDLTVEDAWKLFIKDGNPPGCVFLDLIKEYSGVSWQGSPMEAYMAYRVSQRARCAMLLVPWVFYPPIYASTCEQNWVKLGRPNMEERTPPLRSPLSSSPKTMSIDDWSEVEAFFRVRLK